MIQYIYVLREAVDMMKRRPRTEHWGTPEMEIYKDEKL